MKPLHNTVHRSDKDLHVAFAARIQKHTRDSEEGPASLRTSGWRYRLRNWLLVGVG